MRIRTSISSILSVVVFSACLNSTSAGPLRVYILAGQSNMQGHAHIRTLDHIGMSPDTASILRDIRDEDGNARVHSDVWISSLGSASEIRSGQLTTGYGAGDDRQKIGPELTFGIYMQKHVGQPILIIKTAWGGKSLHTDFRPPGAGPYVFNEQQLENLRRQNKDIDQAKADQAMATGHYYRLMLKHVKTVLSDISTVYPEYNADEGYKLSGFVWFQGWNDMVDRGVYPQRDQPGGYDRYSEVLTQFIRDVRRDFSAPDLPFVIGVMGAGGPVKDYLPGQKRYAGIHSNFRNAMAAPAELPEFRGNVVAVRTEEYWDGQLTELNARWGQVRGKSRELNQDKSLSSDERQQQLQKFTADLFTESELKIHQTGISNAEYHYLGSGKVLAQIGRAFADALAETTHGDAQKR